MMGGHHAATGAAAWVAIASPATYALGWYEQSQLGVVAGALVCAGAALLPDADHHSATIAHSLPPISQPICSALGKLSGGHRHGTHSIVGWVIAMILAWAIGLISVTTSFAGTLAIGSGLIAIPLIAFAAKALKLTRKSFIYPWILAVLLSAFVSYVAPTEWYWLPTALGLGYLVHLIGDSWTTGNIWWTWPLRFKPPTWLRNTPILKNCWYENGYMGMPFLGNAGSIREWVLLVPISLYAIVGITEALASGVVGAAPGWVLEITQRLLEGRPG